MAKGHVYKNAEAGHKYTHTCVGVERETMTLQRFSMMDNVLNLTKFRVPLGYQLYLRFLAELAVLALIMFAIELPSMYDNFTRSGIRNVCRQTLSITDEITSGDQSAPAFDASICGYDGLPIRRDLQPINILMRFGSGVCEEYSNINDVVLPVEPPNPFIPVTAAFCADGSGWSDINGLFNIALFLLFLLRWRVVSQMYAERADNSAHTGADFAVLLSGLGVGEEVDGEHGLQARIFKELTESSNFNLDDTDSGFHLRPWKPGLKDTEFDIKREWIQCGRDCAIEVRSIRALAEISAKQADLENEETPNQRKIKEQEDAAEEQLELLAKELASPSKSTGHAIVCFNTEETRDQFVKKLRFRPSEALPRQYLVKAAASPEPTEILWENFESPRWYELSMLALNFTLTALLVSGAAYVLIYIKDLQAHCKGGTATGSLLELINWIVATSGSISKFLLGTLEAVETSTPFQLQNNTLLGKTKSIINLDLSDNMAAIQRILSIVGTVLVAVVNAVLKKVIAVLTEKEGVDTQTQKQRSLFVKLTMALVINSVVVPLAVALFAGLRMSEGAESINQSWFESGGAVNVGFVLLIITAIGTVPSVVLQPVLLVKRFVFVHFASKQRKLDAYWEPPKVEIATLYASLAQIVAIALIYAPMYPPIYLILAAVAMVFHGAYKFGALYWYAAIPTVDQQIMESLRRVLEVLVLLQIWTMYLVDKQSSSKDGAAAVGNNALMGLGIWIAYQIIKMVLLDYCPCFKLELSCFRDYDQIGGDGEEDNRPNPLARCQRDSAEEGIPSVVASFLCVPTNDEEGPDAKSYDELLKMDHDHHNYTSVSTELNRIAQHVRDEEGNSTEEGRIQSLHTRLKAAYLKVRSGAPVDQGGDEAQDHESLLLAFRLAGCVSLLGDIWTDYDTFKAEEAAEDVEATAAPAANAAETAVKRPPRIMNSPKSTENVLQSSWASRASVHSGKELV